MFSDSEIIGSKVPPEFQLTYETLPSGQVPSLHLHYRGFFTTTNLSAPAPRIDTVSLAGYPLVPFSYTSRQQVPAVQHESPDQAHATSMPGAAWTVSRQSSRPIPEQHHLSGSDAVCALSTRVQWFTCVRLLDPYLMHFFAPFP